MALEKARACDASKLHHVWPKYQNWLKVHWEEIRAQVWPLADQRNQGEEPAPGVVGASQTWGTAELSGVWTLT